jgi:hypothetical protein
LVAAVIDAQKPGALRIFPDGSNGEAEGRVYQHTHQYEAQQKKDQAQQVVIDGGENFGFGDAMDPVIPARERIGLEYNHVKQLAEGQREDGEVQADQANAKPADDGGRNGAGHRRNDHGRHKAETGLFHQQGDGVGARSEKSGMAETDHSAKTHDEVQADGEQGHDDHFRGNPDPELAGASELRQEKGQNKQGHQYGRDGDLLCFSRGIAGHGSSSTARVCRTAPRDG